MQAWQVAAGRARDERRRRSQIDPASSRDRSMAQRELAAPREILDQVRALRDEARQLYRSGLEREANEADLRAARDRLERAFSLLEPLPAGDVTDALRQDLGQLLCDVVRVSPF